MPDLRRLREAGYTLLTSPGTQRFLRKGTWGIADHALISATNFTTMVLIARAVSPGEFGLYSLAYTGLLFSNSLQSALIVQPHTVMGAPRSGKDYVGYTTDTGWLQGGFALLTALVTLVIATIATGFNWWIAPMLLALVPATAAWQLQEFVRRALYTRAEVSKAFANDVVSYGGQFAVLVLLWRVGELTPTTAMIALAATSSAGFLIGLWQIRAHLDWTFSLSRVTGTMRTNWTFGKWLLGGNIAFWTSGQIYPVLAAGLVSVTATGVMRAAQTIIGPTNVLMTSLEPLFGPMTARTYAQKGLPALGTLLSRLQLMILILMGTYCMTVAIFAEPIFRHVYGPEYSQYSWMLILLALTTLVSSLRTPIKLGLKALGQTNAIFRTYLASSMTNLTLGVTLVYLFGFKGVAFGLIANSIVLQSMFWHYQRKFVGSNLAFPTVLAQAQKQASHPPGQRHA